VLLTVLVDWDGMPDHLTLFEEGLIGVSVILFDQEQQIVDDGTGGDGALVVAILTQEAMQEDLFESLSLEPLVSTLSNGLGGAVVQIAADKA